MNIEFTKARSYANDYGMIGIVYFTSIDVVQLAEYCVVSCPGR